MLSEEIDELTSQLGPKDLGHALTALGCELADWHPPLVADAPHVRKGLANVTWRALGPDAFLAELRIRLGVLADALQLKGLASMAPQLLERFDTNIGRPTPQTLARRLCLDLTDLKAGSGGRSQLPWLLQVFGHPALDQSSVYVAWPNEAASLGWNWPLRLAIAPTHSEAEFRADVEACRYRHLFVLTERTRAASDCDVLIFPGSVHDAVKAALKLPALRASAVIVTGEFDAPWPLADAWLESLRRQFRAGAVAVAHVPDDVRNAWFTSLVAEISHNRTLDEALFGAAQGVVRTASYVPEPGNPRPDLLCPLVFGYRDFLDRSRLVELARRVGNAASSVPVGATPVQFQRSFSTLQLPNSIPETVARMGAELARVAGALRFDQETGDATTLAEFVDGVSRATGEPLDLSAIEVTPTTAPGDDAPHVIASQLQRVTRGTRGGSGVRSGSRAPATFSVSGPAEQRRRFVQLALVGKSADGRWVRESLMSGAQRAADVFIGPAITGTVQASRPLDESQLPRNAAEHRLRIVFTPLWRDGNRAATPGQSRDLVLPASGPSKNVRFHFRVPANLPDFRARIIVLHANRVLQTLLMRSVPGRRYAEIELNVENCVSTDWGEDTTSPAFDAALVVNDNPAGEAGLTAISEGFATFFEPEGLKLLTSDIRKELAALNVPEDGDGEMVHGLDDERIQRLLYRLALRGVGLMKSLKTVPELTSMLRSGKRLQVVDAVSGAYFPIEFVYDGKAPAPAAKLCPHAKDALTQPAVHETCANKADDGYFCPAAFWGFSRCIERQPPRGQAGYRFSQPRAGATILHPLRSSLLAASKKVRAEDVEKPGGVEAVLVESTSQVVTAASWSQWKSQVQAHGPSLLVLLPHSTSSSEVAHVPALEISGDILDSVRVDEDYVRTETATNPIVLLLGCSTTLPEIPFLSFVQEFRLAGAAAIVGTLATIRGRQTVNFVRTLLAALKASSGDSATFDEVFLRVKQQMLAEGDPFALSLIAYGDTGWRLAPFEGQSVAAAAQGGEEGP
jgi:hypothetical protein